MGKEVQEINRIVYIEPNEFAELAQKAEKGVSRNNISWNPEDLQFTVDLQVEKSSRFDESGQKKNNTKITGAWASFMSGEQLNTDTDGAAINCLTDAYTNISYTEYTSTGQSSRELLGIDSIEIEFSSHFYPQVKMKMTDVRGASLFQPSEENYQIDEWNKAKGKDKTLSDSEKEAQNKPHLGQSFFKSLFHFPYPRFLLTLKGFYGDKVTFELAVSDFKSAFNSQTGNFDVNVSFIGYMYGMYTDIPMNLVFTAPYYNKQYWDSKKEDGTFCYYTDDGNAGNQMLTFPEFVDRYAHLLKNIDSSELGERENIVRLKKLRDEYDALVKLQASYKMATGFVFEKNSKQQITSGDYRNDVYIYNSKDEIKKSFSNSENVIATFSDKLTENKEKFGKDNAWLEDVKFPSGENDVLSYPIKVDNKFNPIILKMMGSDTDAIKRLLTYATRNDGVVCIYNKQGFDNNLDERIKELDTEISNLKETTDKEVEAMITKALGFKFTVENVYRMIFAHIETFLNYFENTLDEIDKKRAIGERTAAYFSLDPRHSDLPPGKFNNLTFVPPFPSILDNKRTMIYPEASDNGRLKTMDEVHCVNNIVKYVTEYVDATKKAIETLKQAVTSDDDGTSFSTTFDPISVADIFYAVNDENPYEFLEEYMEKNGEKAEYVLYFIYCRIITAYGVSAFVTNKYKRNYKVTSIFEKICEAEINNCINYFNSKSKYFGDDFKEKILGFAIDIINSDGKISKNMDFVKNFTSKWENKLYDFTNSKTDFKDHGYLLYFTNPFNKYVDLDRKFLEKYSYNYTPNENGTGFLEKRFPLSYSAVSLKEFCKRLDSVIGLSSEVSDELSTYQQFKDGYKESNSRFSFTRIRNAESGFYNEDSEANKFILTSNSRIETVEEKDVNSNHQKKYVNLGIKQEQENVETLFLGMKDGFDSKGEDGLKEYYTGLLSYGDIKEGDGKNLFIGQDGKPSLAEALRNVENGGLFTAILFLATMASYYGKTISVTFSNITNIEEIPEILLAYIGGVNYFYDVQTAFTECLSVATEYLGDDVVDYLKEYAIEFVDKHRVTLEKNLKDPNTDYIYKYMKLDVINGSNNELKTFKEYSENFFNNWFEREWGAIRTVVFANEEETNLYNGLVYDGGSLDKVEYNLPMWKHNRRQDKLIKKLLCKTTKVLYIKEKQTTTENFEGDMNNPWSFSPKYMKIFGTKLKEIFSAYETLGQKVAESMENVVTSANHNDIKTALYYTLKNLYDRWFATKDLWKKFELQTPEKDRKSRNKRNTNGNVGERTEFNSFLYVNSFYKDISNSYMMNPEILIKCIESYLPNDNINKNNSVYEFMAEIAEKNKLLMLALPVYNNFYDLETIKSIFTPNVLYGKKDNEKTLGLGNTYLIMYTGEPSKYLGDDNGDYQDDAVDLFGMTEFHGPETYVLFEKESDKGTIDNSGEKNGEFTVPAFGVTYAKQNQMYFKNIAINMDNPQVTDYSLANLIQISYGGKHGDVNQRFGVGQNIYSIYSNRSYTCNVEMMGCMNIMPSMYFQLNNIPMFRGLYMIIKVSHTIQAGNMVTKFMGVRVNKNQLAECKFAFDFQTIYDKINRGLDSKSGGGNALLCGEQDAINLYKKNIRITSEMRTVVKTLIELEWNKSAICGICGAIGAESNFQYWVVNLSEFRGTDLNSTANARKEKPWTYGAGLIQWSNDRKRTLITNVTDKDEKKLYARHEAESVDDFLINMVPSLETRKELNNDKKKRPIEWKGGIENLTLEEQIYCINYELTKGVANLVGGTLKTLEDTIDDATIAVYTVYAKYVGFLRNTVGIADKDEACEVSKRYATQFNESSGLNKRAAYGQWVYEHWEQLIS